MKHKFELSCWFTGFVRNRLVLVGGWMLALQILVGLTAPFWVNAGLLRDPIQ